MVKKRKFLRITVRFFLFGAILGCDSIANEEKEINMIPVTLEIDRFDRKFYQSGADRIPILKKEYPYLFPVQFPDSIWANRQKDSLQRLLQNAIEITFPSLDFLEKELAHLFQHIKFYFPEVKIPHTISLTNNVDYQVKTIYSDSLLLLSLDTFLGSEHPLYEGIPQYIRKEMNISYLPSQVVDKLSDFYVSPPEDRTLLAQMLYHGKKMYLQDLLLPHIDEGFRIGFTSAEMDWVNTNERYIWQYFIEKEILYGTDPNLAARFINPAPFSKFYLAIDNETPGGIGRWVGMQIVKSYVKKYPKTPIDQLLKLPTQVLFNDSNYKPKR